MSPMFSLHSGPTLPLSVPDINAFLVILGSLCFFGRIRLRRKEGVTRIT